MTLAQALAFTVLGLVVALLVSGRVRYDVVGALGLAAAVAAGLVKPQEAFRGFSDDIVVIVGSALVVSAAVARSGIVERLIRPVAPLMRTTAQQVGMLAGAVAVLSAFMKNIGALALFMPIAFQVARRTGIPVSRLLMPLSFAALLGGLMTLIGTSPNIIVSRLREEILGEPFRMFDFLPVGACLAAAGLAFLTVGWRLLPQHRSGAAADAPFAVEDYRAEVRVPEGSPFVGRTVAELEARAEGEVEVVNVVRERFRRLVPSPDWSLLAGDVLVLQSDAQALERLVAEAQLELAHDQAPSGERERRAELAVVEVVVGPQSVMIGQTVEELQLRELFGVNVLAISRRGERVTRLLRRVRFQPGDLLVMRGPEEGLSERLAELGCLPLAARNLKLGEPRRDYLPVTILTLAMILVASGRVPVPFAFFAAAVAMLASGSLRVADAYAAIDGPVLVLLATLIPVSDALRTTGGTDLVAGWLAGAAALLPPLGALALVLVASMAATPFLNNAATVLVMAPIGASLAQRLGLNPDPFLMAVAIGAASDFLTPIGHQCNTLVMGPGGYRFGDYWRLGLPLSLLIVVLGTALIAVFWPLGAAR